jgi:hypothetical protein
MFCWRVCFPKESESYPQAVESYIYVKDSVTTLKNTCKPLKVKVYLKASVCEVTKVGV